MNWFGTTFYGKDKEFKRPINFAWICFWDYKVLPHFKKLDYISQKGGEKLYHYRWYRWYMRIFINKWWGCSN